MYVCIYVFVCVSGLLVIYETSANGIYTYTHYRYIITLLTLIALIALLTSLMNIYIHSYDNPNISRVLLRQTKLPLISRGIREAHLCYPRV